MTMLLILLTAITLFCAVLSLANLSRHDAQQAALQPFADDPETARRMSAETGLACERVVRPAAEPSPAFVLEA